MLLMYSKYCPLNANLGSYSSFRGLSQQLEQARKETAQFKQLEREHEAKLSRMEEEEKMTGVFKKPKPREDTQDHLLPGIPQTTNNNSPLLRTASRSGHKTIIIKNQDKAQPDKKVKKSSSPSSKPVKSHPSKK